MSRQRVYLMGRQAIIPKLEGAATPARGKQRWTDRRLKGKIEEDRGCGEAESLGLGCVLPPYKENLMGQLNRYHRRVHKWLFNF